MLQAIELIPGLFSAKVRGSETLKSKLASHNKETVIFVHGVPGIRNRWNHDLAQEIASHCHHDVYVFHHRGLGESSGDFSFLKTFEDSLSLVEKIQGLHPGQALSFVGHSWGGLVALFLAAKNSESLARLSLMAPFCMVPSREQLTALLARISTMYKDIFASGTLEITEEDFQKIHALAHPVVNGQKLGLDSERFMILQGSEDPLTPAVGAERLAAALQVQESLKILPEDHNLMKDRVKVKKLLCDFFSTPLENQRSSRVG